MDIDQIIKAAVEPIVPVCTIDVYGGNATEFCVYTYTETPMAFGDDRATLHQIHGAAGTGVSLGSPA